MKTIREILINDASTKACQWFALFCAKQVLPIFEKKYPNDKKVSECIETTELYLLGKTSLKILRDKRYAAYAAAYAADAADAVAYADAAAYAAYAADAADAVADAADADDVFKAQRKELRRLMRLYPK